MKQCEVVKVVQLDEPSRPYTGTEGVTRPPQVGDTGAIVLAGTDGRFTVEAVTVDGETLWLADFTGDELENMNVADRWGWGNGKQPDVEAQVTFLPTSEGGRETPALSGYRPAHRVRDDYLTSGTLQFLGASEAAPGATVRAFITFITPEAYPACLSVGQILDVQEGSRLVAHARVLRIYNDSLRATGHAPFHVGQRVTFSATERDRGKVVMTEEAALVPGRQYRVVGIVQKSYVVVDGFENTAGGGLHWTLFRES